MYFGEINLGIRVWFARRIRRTLETFRDWEKSSWELRHRLSDPEVLGWMVEWYGEHVAEFIRDDPGDTFCVDDIHNDEQVVYRREAVNEKCWEVLGMATRALTEIHDARRFADLDSWLEALHAGDLEWSGPTEEHGESFVVDYPALRTSARKRRVRWPRVCRTCGDEFRIERGNAKNCADCRAKRRAGAS